MPPLLCPSLVGRKAELDAIAALVREPGGTAFVVGEPGMGKTRLMRETARTAGIQVLDGRAVPAGRVTPYRPLAEAVVAACRQHGPPQEAELVPYRAALGRLLPEWKQPGQAPEAGLVLGEGVLRLLGALGAGSRMLLCIDDLHWADPDTVEVLEYLVDHAGEAGLCVVATARPEPGPGWDLIRDLSARRAATVLDLAPLAGADVAEMARACLATDALPPGLEGLLTRAEGVPFLIEELLSAASATGRLTSTAGDWRLDPGAAGVLPATFADGVARRVATLSPADRDVPGAAALLGRQVDVALLAGLLGRPAVEMLAVLDACVEAQVLVRDVAGYRFRHALSRDAARASLSSTQVIAMASRARGLVEAVHPGLPGEWCLLAAELAGEAGEHADAVGLLCRAARRALDTGALTTAGQLLDRAGVQGPEAAELRVEVAARRGDMDAATAAGALLLADGADPERRVRVRLLLAEGAAAAGRWAESLDHLDQADATDARAGALRAHVLLGCARHAEAEAAARTSLAAADDAGDAKAACQALEVLGRILRERDTDAAERTFLGQLARADEHGLTLWRMRATHELGGLDLRRANDTDRLRSVAEESERAGALTMAATALLQVAMSHWISLDIGQGIESARRCQDAARRAGHDQVLTEALMLEATAHGLAGSWAAAERTFATLLGSASDDPEVAAAVDVAHGQAALMGEDRAGALAGFDAGVSRVRGRAIVYVRPYWHLWALLRTVQDDRGDEARAEVRRLEQSPITIAAAMLHYGDAIAAGRRGDHRAATRAFTTGRAHVDGAGFAARRHLAERLVAECSLADGWGDPVAWLTAAARYFHDAGHGRLERACRRLLRQAGAPVPRREHGHRGSPHTWPHSGSPIGKWRSSRWSPTG